MPKREIDILRDKVKEFLDNYHASEKVNIKGKLYKVQVPIWSGEFLS